MLTHNQIGPFVWIAWAGVATTALNTLVPVVTPEIVGDLGTFRDVVLLIHAPATLLPLLALSLLAFQRAPFVAVVVMTFTLLEKSLEFAGQALQLFPPEETLGGVPVEAIVDAIWDQMFFVLWLCNTVGATGAGFLMHRMARPPVTFVSVGFAWAAAALTLGMLLGPEYVGWDVPATNAILFFVIFTGYRIAIALTLARSMASTAAAEHTENRTPNKTMEPTR